MAEQTISLAMTRRDARRGGTEPWRQVRNPIAHHPWLLVTALLLAVSVAFVVLTRMRPAFDAYGWLVWGRQAAHFDLDTNAAPSWKPLTFLFTFPYTLFAGRGALWLWMVTAVAGALASAVFAARIAYKLVGPCPGRRYAPIAGAVFAACGVLGLQDYWHLIQVAYSDGLIVALCLGAVDRHLSQRPRQAWLLFVLASLGRPEVWPIAFLYGLWAWRARPEMRTSVAVGLAVIPLLWFGVAALTSRSWWISGDVALKNPFAGQGHPVSRVLSGFLSLYEWPMKLAALFALALAAIRRERTWLLLAAGALLWVLVEVGFALHGWSGNRRYMFAPAAVMVVLAGAGVGRVLAIAPRHLLLLRWAAPAAVVALLVALAPHARVRARLAHNEIVYRHGWTRSLNGLHAVIRKEGGARRILRCGQAVVSYEYQSILAWELSENVANVGWDPPAWINQRQPIVLFSPNGSGWQVRPMNIPAASRANCARLWMNTASN